MNKRFLLVFLVGICGLQLASGQLILRHIDRSAPAKKQQSLASARVEMEPLTLPFWDDFSTSIDVPDTNLWEYGEHVFINNTIGIDPPSLNVATFDGAQRNGRPYQITEEKPGPTDSLISRPINLAVVPFGQRGNVFLSFYWQLKGFGEIPESIDSIRLQLMGADSVWYTVWSQQGGIDRFDSLFRYEEINLRALETGNRTFFHDEFRIKFQGFSTLRGIYDTWNLDYVYINRYSRPFQPGNPQNRTILDRAISDVSVPLFGLYYEVPIDQLRVNPTIRQQTVALSNIDRSDIHPVQYSHVLTNTNDGTVLAQDLLIDGPLLFPGEIDHYPGIDTTTLASFAGDSVVIESEFSFRTGDSQGIQEILPNGDTIVFSSARIWANDTVRFRYLLQDHLAYDDGTAEFAAGINLDQGQVAVQFVLPSPDTLTHVDIYFPALPATAGQPMDIVVWKRLTETGEITRVSHVVQETNLRNQFARIALFDGQILEDTFYVGYQQFTDDYVAIGLDRSNELATSKTFVNTSREWVANTDIIGALMIRPVFGDVDDLVLSAPGPVEESLIVYPNPTTGSINIRGDYERLELYGLGGLRIFASDYSPKLDPQLPRGLYILRFYRKTDIVTKKLIVE